MNKTYEYWIQKFESRIGKPDYTKETVESYINFLKQNHYASNSISIATQALKHKAKQLGIEYIPVVNGGQGNEFVGVLDTNAVYRRLSAEVLAKQHEADSMYNLGVGGH